MKIIILLALVFAVLVMPAHGYILDVEPEPAYSYGLFLEPLEVEMMEQLEIFQIIVIASMLFVNGLKVFGTYFAIKFVMPDLKFNPAFAVAGLLGVYVGYVAYMSTNPVMDATYVDIFMQAGFYALSADLLFDFAGKMKNKLSNGVNS